MSFYFVLSRPVSLCFSFGPNIWCDSLGLDIARFKSSATELPEREFKTLQSQVSDKERFALTEPFRVRCRSCDAETLYDGFENSVSSCDIQHSRDRSLTSYPLTRRRCYPPMASSAVTPTAPNLFPPRPLLSNSISRFEAVLLSSTPAGWCAMTRRVGIERV